MLTRSSSILIHRRKERLKLALQHVKLDPDDIILDVGCGTHGRSLPYFIRNNKIIGIDLLEPEEIEISYPNFEYNKLDARDMRLFSDKQFKVAFIIGTLEHESDISIRVIMKEVRRVAKTAVVMVPARGAIFESHFKFPFFSILPSQLQHNLAVIFDLGGFGKKAASDKNFIHDNFRWLPIRQWRSLLGDCHVYYASPFFETLIFICN